MSLKLRYRGLLVVLQYDTVILPGYRVVNFNTKTSLHLVSLYTWSLQNNLAA